jgi:hypothetical protein
MSKASDLVKLTCCPDAAAKVVRAVVREAIAGGVRSAWKTPVSSAKCEET